jgi:Predicted Co/Zn/Cd cation transporters
MSTRPRQDKKNPDSRKSLWGNLLDALFNRHRKVRGRPEGKEEPAEELMQVVQRVEGVVTVESIRAREQGHYVVAEIVISVNPKITVQEGQEIAKRVKMLLMARFLHLSDVSVYVEPYDPGYPYKSNHDPNQEHMPTLLQ